VTAALTLAFTAGLVATVNPCGIAMLPAYLSYFLGLDDEATSGTGAITQALMIGATVTAGFLTVFGLAGLLITAGLRQIIGLIPWAALIVGVGIGSLGMVMLAGFQPSVRLPQIGRGPSSRRLGSVFAFGIAYAVASLSCTLPIFLVVVAGTIPNLSLVGGVVTFLVYGLGMSLVVLVLTLAVAFGRRALVRWIRRSAQHVNRLAGLILVLAGGYITVFWLTELRHGAAEPAGLTVLIERLSARLNNLLGAAPLAWGVGMALLIAGAASYRWRDRRRARRPAGDDVDGLPDRARAAPPRAPMPERGGRR
jgi:cytochrome c-type biogenesis protein